MRKVICSVNRPEDLTAGLEEAEKLIFDNWEEELRRFHRGH